MYFVLKFGSMVLYINTKDREKVIVSLKKDGEVVESLSAENEYGSQVLLPLIEKLLENFPTELRMNWIKNPQVSIQIHPKGGHINWGILEGVEVETGPGSFTGLRVGVSIANTLGFALGIPVNGKKLETNLVY